MITNISKINSFGSFRNFKWNKKTPNFKKYNLIYGWNYTGKTMLSRIFRCVELEKNHPDFPNAGFEFTDKNRICHYKLSNSPYQFRVFNTDFIKENLHWDSQEANPIFILGKKDFDLQNSINSLKEEISNLGKDRENLENEKIKLDNHLENSLTKKSRELDRIKSPYDKRKLKTALEYIKSNLNEYYLDKSVLRSLLKTLRTQSPDKLPTISINILDQDELKKIQKILEKTVTSLAIEKLKNNPNLNSWIREGISLHKNKKICEFCGSLLPVDLLEKYNQHFSLEYENLINSLNDIIKTLMTYKITSSLYDEKRICPELENKFKETKVHLEKYIKEYNQNIDTLIKLTEDKINNPFKKIKIISLDVELIKKFLKQLNEILINHNKFCDNFSEEQKKSFRRLELYYAYEFEKENSYFDSINKLQHFIQKEKELGEIIKKKKDEIKEIESQLSDITKASDKINYYLKSIFGKDRIILVPSGDKKFIILRDNLNAKNLSEGEKSAISFSYFLTRLDDKETNLSNSIIFIDDPVSSLDSHNLYNIFSLIETKLENCHQLFISTHNLEFFSLLKEWFIKDIKSWKGKSGFYIIETIIKNGKECSDIKVLPSVLLDFRSEYHFLFYNIKSFTDNPPTDDFKRIYQLPNIIRRFLEAFIGFKYAEGLNRGLPLLIDDNSERIKVSKFINILSHHTSLSRSLHYFSDISECKSVVDIVIRSIKRKDIDHYKVLEEKYNKAKSSLLELPKK